MLIGSFVNPVGYEESISGLITIAMRVFMLDQTKEVLEKRKDFDLLIAPPELTKFGILEVEKADDIFEMGYKKTKEKLKDPEVHKIAFGETVKPPNPPEGCELEWLTFCIVNH